MYTEEEMESPYFIQTPQPDGSEIASQIISMCSISILSLLFGIKSYNVQYKYLSLSRWLVLALYLFSWSFTTSSMIFTSTNNGNYISCYLSIMACDIFYSATKLTTYWWLIEKVWVVSSVRQSRWRTPIYRFHCLLLTPYAGIFSLMIVFHIAELKDTGECIIGLETYASVPLMLYDFLINFYMTILFVKPLWKSSKTLTIDWKMSRLHEVAERTMVASIVCLFASLANLVLLLVFHGRERGLFCLSCCTVDVTINVVTVHWVTSSTTTKKPKDSKISSLTSPGENYSNQSVNQPIDRTVAESSQQIDPKNLQNVVVQQAENDMKSQFDLAPYAQSTETPLDIVGYQSRYYVANRPANNLEIDYKQPSFDSHYSSPSRSHESSLSLTKSIANSG
ncbi:hypothetical protein J3Q64DRAFT_1766683 [Phycomyces blakesleeanus]|uniref:G-protein coupled receptors family 2 profile 2 domain-containing protein n=1 Tax=Phycomyces blakesleeanus TaxID=4837 RepID=A0ABR3APG9_PHYBL